MASFMWAGFRHSPLLRKETNYVNYFWPQIISLPAKKVSGRIYFPVGHAIHLHL
jgi:hypothetical protein